jgi:hypothetical protein
MRGKPSEKPANQGNPTFLFRIVKFADLTGVKSDRLLASRIGDSSMFSKLSPREV